MVGANNTVIMKQYLMKIHTKHITVM